jgi:hypothetical protein
MPSHKFRVGETVTLIPSISRNVAGGIYQVIRQLPHNGVDFEYQIKSANEEHQRVAKETELSKAVGTYSPARHSQPGQKILTNARQLNCSPTHENPARVPWGGPDLASPIDACNQDLLEEIRGAYKATRAAHYVFLCCDPRARYRSAFAKSWRREKVISEITAGDPISSPQCECLRRIHFGRTELLLRELRGLIGHRC